MKELSMEQNTKAYDEALERAKSEYQSHESFNGFCEMLTRIFPELREEEDNEKISAMLIRHIRQERGSLSKTAFVKSSGIINHVAYCLTDGVPCMP